MFPLSVRRVHYRYSVASVAPQLPLYLYLAHPPQPLEEAYLVASVGLEEVALLLLLLLLDCSAVLLRLLQPLVPCSGQRLPQLPLHRCSPLLQPLEEAY